MRYGVFRETLCHAQKVRESIGVDLPVVCGEARLLELVPLFRQPRIDGGHLREQRGKVGAKTLLFAVLGAERFDLAVGEW